MHATHAVLTESLREGADTDKSLEMDEEAAYMNLCHALGITIFALIILMHYVTVEEKDE